MIPAFLLQSSIYSDLAASFCDQAVEPEVPKSDLPPSRVGKYAIQKFEVDRQSAIGFNAKHIAGGQRERCVLPGSYTKLVRIDQEFVDLSTGKIRQDGIIWMSDTTAERNDHQDVYDACKRLGGRVLIHGLGLGVITNAVCALPNVEHVEVWELEESVIKLCGDFYREKYGPKLTIVHGDVFNHRPAKGERWSVVWHDIWPTLGSKHLKPMQQLCARFRTRCDWQECWGREFSRWMAREERKYERTGTRW
jgi:hypothetical protein